MLFARYPLLALLLLAGLLSGCALGLPDSTTAQEQGYARQQSEQWGYD